MKKTLIKIRFTDRRKNVFVRLRSFDENLCEEFYVELILEKRHQNLWKGNEAERSPLISNRENRTNEKDQQRFEFLEKKILHDRN